VTELRRKLVWKFVTGISFAGTKWIASLDDKAGDYSMEGQAVIERFARIRSQGTLR
jgi:hypothetical protein